VGSSLAVAQARLLVVLATTSTAPLLRGVAKLATAEPRLEEIVVAGVPTTLARPGRARPCAMLVFVNGVTARGRRHPDVQRLARALARAGFLVLIPDLTGLARGEITEGTVAAAVAVGCAAADRPEALDRRIGLLGVSVGATVALLAAEDRRLAERVSAVAGIAPYTDWVNVVRLATTGTYPNGKALDRYPVPAFLGLVVARSLAAGLPEGADRDLLRATLATVEADALDPLAELRRFPRAGLSPSALAVLDLTLNRDPGRFDTLYAALPAEMRAAGARLSPLAGADRLRAPIELASAPCDRYFPPAESRALARAASSIRVTVTSALAHADPRIGLRDLRGLAQLWGFGVRALRSMAS
jgi:pimeloyl-ACP methyl ester carboxylesterase